MRRRNSQFVVVLVAAPAVIEAAILLWLGVSPAPALLAAGPAPIASLHDLVLVMALPLPMPAGLAVAAVLFGARVAQLGILARADRVVDTIRYLAASWLVSLVPAALLTTFWLTSLSYVWMAAAVIWGVGIAVVGPVLRLQGRSLRTAVLVTTALGAVASMAARVHPLAAAVVAVVGAVVVGRSWVGAELLPVARRPRRRRAVAALAACGVLTTSAGIYAVIAPDGAVAAPPIRLDAAPGTEDPVLIVDGFASVYHSRVVLGGDVRAWGFSYRGIDDDGRTIPHLPSDTLAGIRAAVPHLADQVQALAATSDDDVTLVGISLGALVARTAVAQGAIDADLLDRVVLVDLPAAGSILRHPTVDGRRGLTGAALWATAALGQAVTPLRIDADAVLPRDLQGCALPDLARPLPVTEVRLRSLTDVVAALPPSPAAVETRVFGGAHALTLTTRAGADALRWALGRADTPAPAPIWQGAGLLVNDLVAAWRPPDLRTEC